MTIRVVATAVLLSLISVPAYALTEIQIVTPKSTKEEGVTVETAKRPDGTFGFTITRYLDKEPKLPADSQQAIRRTATLEIRTPDRLMLATRVDGETTKDTVVYWFALSREMLASTHFSISERSPAQLGSSRYDFNLLDFVPPLPLHP